MHHFWFQEENGEAHDEDEKDDVKTNDKGAKKAAPKKKAKKEVRTQTQNQAIYQRKVDLKNTPPPFASSKIVTVGTHVGSFKHFI